MFLVVLRGHTAEEWAPLVARFVLGRWSRRARFRAQLAQVGHVVGVPDGGLQPESPGEPRSLPAELAGLEFIEGELAQYGGTPFGVAADRTAKTMTAVLRCQGESFALLSAEDRERRLADYGGVLAALARDGSPVRRIAWTERTLPANRDQLAQYVLDHKREDLVAAGADRRARQLFPAAAPRARRRRGSRAAVLAADRHPSRGGAAGDQAPRWGRPRRRSRSSPTSSARSSTCSRRPPSASRAS